MPWDGDTHVVEWLLGDVGCEVAPSSPTACMNHSGEGAAYHRAAEMRNRCPRLAHTLSTDAVGKCAHACCRGG